MADIARNVAEVQRRIAAAAERAGRSPSEITLVAVSKKQPATALREAIAAGIAEFGENYVQEARAKRGELMDERVRWHMIGHLQTNKAIQALDLFDFFQSVDSVRLAAALGKAATARGRAVDILAQVHLGDEATKAGLQPERTRDAVAEMAAIPGIAVQGLMGIAPLGVDARPYFRQLYGLFSTLAPENRKVLSMGMTADFETAIEEGATMPRVGSALFGPRRA
jgi:pyridoxal phosphate enzyme (YggS family)